MRRRVLNFYQLRASRDITRPLWNLRPRPSPCFFACVQLGPKVLRAGDRWYLPSARLSGDGAVHDRKT